MGGWTGGEMGGLEERWENWRRGWWTGGKVGGLEGRWVDGLEERWVD